MIQRKQSLFLAAVLIIAVLVIFIPFMKLTTSSSQEFTLCLMPGAHPDIEHSTIYFPMIFNFLVIILSVVTIFKFKNRVLQYKLANLLALLNVFIMGMFFILSYTKIGVEAAATFYISSFLPILSIMLSFLAAHFIKKDEQLVRSADRIR